MRLNMSEIENNLRTKISKEITLMEEGIDRFRVFTPFEFDDGDHLSIVLKKANGTWEFTDEAHTIMHMSYDMDISALKKGNRQKILTNTISNFGLEQKEGAISVKIENDNFGDAFYSFVQALIKITDLSYLSKEQVRSTFYEDFADLMSETIPKNRLTFDYTDPNYDKEGKYVVDCRINGMQTPIFVFAILNDSKCKDVMISMYQFERWRIENHSIAIFNDQETIDRRVLAKFSDIGEKQFSSLLSSKERIKSYLSVHVKD